MSSLEPRLSQGEGLSELHTQIVTAVGNPRADSSNSLNTPSGVSLKTANRHTASEVHRSPMRSQHRGAEALPPLPSLSDLVLEAPAWLFSAAVHMLVVIVLALLFIVPERQVELLLQLDNQEGFEELAGSEFDLDIDVTEQTMDASIEPQELVALDDLAVVDPTDIEPPVLNTEALEQVAPIQMALAGRSQGMQQKLLDAYGGTGETQRAVMMALRWLERWQGGQGLWSMTGRYQDGSGTENQEAATGLALLAFQGAGYTPHGDPQHDFTKVTSQAWKSLLRRQNEDGSFFQQGGRSNGRLYTHAICTIALCELYGMTQDSRYMEPAQRAIDYCVRIQAKEGGWRYFPGSDSDMSVTGWFVMALQSARMAGLQVPMETLRNVSGFLDSVSQDNGALYGYRPNVTATQSMTAEGLLCRQYLGWEHSDRRLRKGASYLIERLPEWNDDRDVYYWYYATQVCHHMEGNYWRTWNEAMRTLLPQNQAQEGRERGSWDPKGDEWGNEGGRLYVTCLSTFMLEVYYRHLPIYQAEALGSGLEW